MKYTTIDAIALRLSKRLQLGTTPAAFGKAELQLELLALVSPQCEARFEAYLAPHYQVPLSLTLEQSRAIAASIVEKMILSEVLPVQIIPETGAEGGLRKLMAQEWQRELKEVQEGVIRLEGEKIAASAAAGFPFSNALIVSQRGRRNPGRAEQINW